MIRNDVELEAALERIRVLRLRQKSAEARAESEQLLEIEAIKGRLREYVRLSRPRIPCDRSSVKLDLPLYAEFWKLVPHFRERFPHIKSDSLVSLGVRFFKPSRFINGGNSCTPVNSLQFGWGGGGSEHLSFLVANERISADSPVILTAPSSDAPNWNQIVARNFREFMRFGLVRGFQVLIQLAYSEKTLRILNDPNWQPTIAADEYFVTRPGQRPVLDFVAESLGLEPKVPTAEEYQALQEEFMPMLRMSRDYLIDLDHYGELEIEDW